MNGPEHYREAQKMLAAARLAMTKQQTGSIEVATQFTAEAQVHATLALAAATAMHATADGTDLGVSEAEFQAWYDAAGVKATEVAR